MDETALHSEREMGQREVFFKEIRKRDGRLVPFDPTKITDAIFKAVLAVGGSNREIAENLTWQVIRLLKENSFNGVIPSVEEVQDCVEKVLIENGHARTAKAYILYRDRRTRIREAKSELMDIVKEILVETSRENANISNSPSAKMLQIGMAASKKLLSEQPASRGVRPGPHGRGHPYPRSGLLQQDPQLLADRFDQPAEKRL